MRINKMKMKCTSNTHKIFKNQTVNDNTKTIMYQHSLPGFKKIL